MAVRLSAAMLLAAGVAGCAALGVPLSLGEGDRTEKAEELMRQAREVEESNRDTALVLYQQAITISGSSPVAYLRLGDAYTRMHRLKDAVGAYRKAVAGDPDNAEAQLGLGTALVRKGEIKEGIVALEKAAPVVATGTAYNRLGVAQTMAGEFSQAQESYERGLSIAPEDIDIATNLAIAAALGQDTEKAGKVAAQIAVSPGATAVHRRNLVIVYGIIGRTSEEARAVAPGNLKPTEFSKLFDRAAAISKITDPAQRAQAVGTIQGG